MVETLMGNGFMFFHRNLIKLSQYFMYSIEDLAQGINEIVLRDTGKNPRVSSKKLRYHADFPGVGREDSAIEKAALEILELDETLYKKENLFSWDLNPAECWIVAGIRVTKIAQENKDLYKDVPPTAYMADTLWSNLGFIESLYERCGLKFLCTSISNASYRTSKSRRLVLPFAVLRELGNRFNIHPYPRFFLEEFSEEEKIQIIRQIGKEEKLPVGEDILFREIELQQLVEKLNKRISDPVDNMGFYYQYDKQSHQEILEVLESCHEYYSNLESEIESFQRRIAWEAHQREARDRSL
ncbi:MAG: hypothetical protein MJZ16_13010 [Bacteroidales bacterium]|nr:hypothetical protein [Bacteroidales bacterium]